MQHAIVKLRIRPDRHRENKVMRRSDHAGMRRMEENGSWENEEE
jgi:hypothetical protein